MPSSSTARLHPLAIARQPHQHRARVRFDQVLAAAEALLVEEGLSGFSIPAVAQRLGYTRASIYKFFPTPYAVLNELVQGKLADLEARLMRLAPEIQGRPWPEGLRAMVLKAAAFYNADRVARLLILGGPVSDDSYRVQELTIQRLGGLARSLLPAGLRLPATRPDAAMLLVEIGTTCFRVSQFLHGRITPEYQEEAVIVMQGYVSRHAAGGRVSS